MIELLEKGMDRIIGFNGVEAVGFYSGESSKFKGKDAWKKIFDDFVKVLNNTTENLIHGRIGEFSVLAAKNNNKVMIVTWLSGHKTVKNLKRVVLDSLEKV